MTARAIMAACLLGLTGCGLSAVEIGGAAVVTYYGKDGFFWEVQDNLIARDTYRITVTQGRFKESGAGEAEIYFRRRASEIAAIQGCSGYTVLAYTESVISDPVWFGRRISEGTIRCERTKALPPA